MTEEPMAMIAITLVFTIVILITIALTENTNIIIGTTGAGIVFMIGCGFSFLAMSIKK